MEEFNLYVCVRAENGIRASYSLNEAEIEPLRYRPPVYDDHGISDNEASYCRTNSNGSSKSNIETASCKRFDLVTHILLIKPLLEILESNENDRRQISEHFRKNTTDSETSNKRCDCFIILNVDLTDSYVIDYAWGWRLWYDCQIILERESATAWLSTLGGGFSALGDYSKKFATLALQTSLQQLRLAKMCNDESGVARGYLFIALSFSQLGFGRFAKILLKNAWNHPSYDPRHKNMCLGVQSKLNYDMEMRRLNRNKIFSLKTINLWNAVKKLTI